MRMLRVFYDLDYLLLNINITFCPFLKRLITSDEKYFFLQKLLLKKIMEQPRETSTNNMQKYTSLEGYAINLVRLY